MNKIICCLIFVSFAFGLLTPGSLVLAAAPASGSGSGVLQGNQFDAFIKQTGIKAESKDWSAVVASVVKTVLVFLGIVFMLLVLYGGFLWMTAGGDDKKIVSAKAYLINATIGLAIVLAAYAITRFIFDVLLTATK